MRKVVLEFRDVSLFPNAAVSIQDFNLTVYQGECLVILGADGSGKRLLSCALHGEIPVQQGEILLEGEIYHPASIQQAHQKRVFCVSQNSNLIDNQSIAENIFYNLGGLKPFHLVNNRLIVNEANEILASYGLNIDSRQTSAGISPATKCIIEIIKWHIHGARVIILDNVLAIAGQYEYEMFRHIVKIMCQKGTTILLLSNHCIAEYGSASRCVLLSKDGRIARIIAPDEFSADEINTYLCHTPNQQILPPDPSRKKQEILRAEHLSAGKFHDLNFSLYSGEALGILCDTGEIYGSLADVLSGSCSYNGQLLMDGKPVRIRNESEAVRLGIGVLFSDTRKMYFPDLSAKENVTLPFLKRISNRFGALNHKRIQALEQDAMDCFESLRHRFSPSKSEEYMLSILSRYLLYPYQILVLPFSSAINDAHKESMVKYLAMNIRSKGGSLIIISTRKDRLQGLGCRIIDLRSYKN